MRVNRSCDADKMKLISVGDESNKKYRRGWVRLWWDLSVSAVDGRRSLETGGGIYVVLLA
jgi:hypothetical protein